MGKKILKYLSSLLVLLILILLGLYLIPPKQEIIDYEYAEIERNPVVNSKIGWYKANDGNNYQITWGAHIQKIITLKSNNFSVFQVV